VTVVVVTLAVLLGACGSSNRTTDPPPTTVPVPSTTTTAATSTTAAPQSTTTRAVRSTSSMTAPDSAAVAFHASVSAVTARDLPSTYRPGCPVGPAQLRMLHLTYFGFDARAHDGTMVVAASVASKVVDVFRSLYEQHFPIRRMQPEDAFGGSDPMSMATDNTSGFNCRNAVASGPPRWSAHAYGTAIDVNTVENPYVEGGVVQPANGAAYVDRSPARPGMAEPGGVLNRAFAAIGWQWGGRWTATPDYQHFSADGG
jgi:hypothetical protein